MELKKNDFAVGETRSSWTRPRASFLGLHYIFSGTKVQATFSQSDKRIRLYVKPKVNTKTNRKKRAVRNLIALTTSLRYNKRRDVLACMVVTTK